MNFYCFNQRYNTYFGANPDWGQPIGIASIDSHKRSEAQAVGVSTFCKGLYGGLDCQSFVGWSIHNAGFKAENTHGSYGNGSYEETKKYKESTYALYDSLEIGDIISNDGHAMLFLSHYDDNNDGKKDGIYVYEAATRIGMRKWSYQELYNYEYYTIHHMANYYNNHQSYACLKDYYGNTVNIPDAWKDKASLFRLDCKAE